MCLMPAMGQQTDSIAAPDTTAMQLMEYGSQRKTYEIADITVSGADNYEDFVLIGFSGLAVGDKIEVPGDQISKAIKKFWKQGLFSDVRIEATKIEGQKIWLNIHGIPSSGSLSTRTPRCMRATLGKCR